MYNKLPKYIKVADSKHVAHYLHTNRLAKPLPCNYAMATAACGCLVTFIYSKYVTRRKSKGIKKAEVYISRASVKGQCGAYILHAKGRSYS